MADKVLVTPAEVQAMMGPGVVLIDTRAPDAYAAGHIPGAVNVHDIFTYLATSTPEGMAALRQKFADAFGAAGLSGAETAVCYEESMNSGFGQSCRGYFLLSWLGYEKAMVLHGGFQAWTAAGLPVSTEVPAPAPKAFPLTDKGASMMIDKDAMLAAVGDDGVVKLDVRDELVTVRAGFLPAYGSYSRGEVARVVPDDEADSGGADVQGAGRDQGRGLHGGHRGGHAGIPVLLQGRAGIQHAGGVEGGGSEGRADVLRLMERVEPGPGVAGRERVAVRVRGGVGAAGGPKPTTKCQMLRMYSGRRASLARSGSCSRNVAPVKAV